MRAFDYLFRPTNPLTERLLRRIAGRDAAFMQRPSAPERVDNDGDGPRSSHAGVASAAKASYGPAPRADEEVPDERASPCGDPGGLATVLWLHGSLPRPRPARRPDPRRWTPVPQPRQREKIFPLGASWTAVSLNGKPFGGERPSFSSTASSAPRALPAATPFRPPPIPCATRASPSALRPHQEDLRQGRHGHRAASCPFAPPASGTSRADPDHQEPGGELRFERAVSAL